MTAQEGSAGIPQYKLGKILFVWVAAAAPMGLLGWIVAPALARGSANPGVVRLAALAVGLVWQFVLVLILLSQETGGLRWSTIRERLWLVPPSNSAGRTDRRLWWWLIPLILVTAAYVMIVSGLIDSLWVSLFPALAEPPGFSLGGFLESPEGRASMIGNWAFFMLFVVQAVFNTILGEELLFRGLLLPRMAGAFGKWDWLANGVLFSLYHWHMPWIWLSTIIDGALFYALPTRRFRSAWFGIILHSGQSVFFAFLLLGMVLGLA